MAQAQANSRSDIRRHQVTDLWTQQAQPVVFGREQFRFTIDRSVRRLPTITIDPYVETAEWRRAGASRTGTLNFYRPRGEHGAQVAAAGDYLICEWSQWGTDGPWKRLWRMKIDSPSQQVYEALITLTLSSDLGALMRSKVAWRFRKDKQHPNGWTADQITVFVCHRFDIPLGHLPKGTWRITKWTPKSLSPQDVITYAWGQERKHTGRRFDVDSSTGTVNVTELAEPQYMLILGATIEDATVSQSTNGLASAVVATSTHKEPESKDSKGRKHQKVTKLRARVVNQQRLDRYGYIVKTLKAPSSIDSDAALRDWAKRRLATMFGDRKTVQFNHPGIPLMDRGTAMRLYLPEAGISNVVFCTVIDQSLSAGSYEMQVTVSFDDPFQVDEQKATVQQKKDAAAARRARARAKKKAASTTKPATSSVRSNS